MDNVYEEFSDITSCIAALDARKENAAFRDAVILHSKEEGQLKQNFTKTKSYDEAISLFENGYMEVFPQLSQDVEIAPYQQRRKVRLGQVGFTPHVANYLQGCPNNMIYQTRETQKVNTLHIVYNITVNFRVTTEDTISAGRLLLANIQKLEASGIRVKLDIIANAVTSTTQEAILLIKLKDYDEALNISKMCFPFVHPSMLRRVAFRWLETQPEVKSKKFSKNYGYPLGNADVKKAIPEGAKFLSARCLINAIKADNGQAFISDCLS